MSYENPASTPALSSSEAGRYLADKLGLSKPLTDQRVWALARARVIPCMRLGRRVLFRTADLDAWISSGGAGYPSEAAEGPRNA